MDEGNGPAIDRTCVLVWSEFSRRILQNDNGTDHGSQGPMFVIGGSVNGGVYGNHPNIDEACARRPGQHACTSRTPITSWHHAFRSTDFRDVYGTVLKRWLQIMSPQVAALSRRHRGRDVSLGDQNFDMGFLPPVPPG